MRSPRPAAEQSFAFGACRTKKRVSRLDAFLNGAKVETHARDLEVELRIVARFAPWREAEHAPIEGLVLFDNGREGKIGLEIFHRLPRGAQRNIGESRKSPGEFNPRREARQIDDHPTLFQVRHDQIGIGAESRKHAALVGGDMDPDRAGKLAIDECGRDPRVWRVIEGFVIKLAIGARLDEPLPDIGLISEPIDRFFFGRRNRATMLYSLKESEHSVRKS